MRPHFLEEDVERRRADGDHDAPQHAETNRPRHPDQGEDKLHTADAPDFAQACDIDEADRGADENGAERGRWQNAQRVVQIEKDRDVGQGRGRSKTCLIVLSGSEERCALRFIPASAVFVHPRDQKRPADREHDRAEKQPAYSICQCTTDDADEDYGHRCG